jgi:hypothetical protein
VHYNDCAAHALFSPHPPIFSPHPLCFRHTPLYFRHIPLYFRHTPPIFLPQPPIPHPPLYSQLIEKYACAPLYAWISVHRHQMRPAQQSLPPARCAKGVKTIGRRGKNRGGTEGGEGRTEEGRRSEGKGGEGGEHLLLGLGCAMLA